LSLCVSDEFKKLDLDVRIKNSAKKCINRSDNNGTKYCNMCTDLSNSNQCDRSRLNSMTTWERSKIRDQNAPHLLCRLYVYFLFWHYLGCFSYDITECSPANQTHSDGGFLIRKCLKMSENYNEPVSRPGKCAVTAWFLVHSHLSVRDQNGRCHGHCQEPKQLLSSENSNKWIQCIIT
jgi:hypothetical protein